METVVGVLAGSSSSSSSSNQTSKERKRQHRWEQKNRWMAHYELKYGVAPTEFVLAGSNNGGSAVASATAATTPVAAEALLIDGIPVVLKAKCRFCECFGRETVVADTNADAAAAASGSNGGAAVAAADATGSTSKSRSSAAEDNCEPDDFAAAVGATSSSELIVHNDSDAPRASKRRKKRQTLKVFGPNFRTDNLESHLSREHPTKWHDYERLRDSDKTSFFPDVPVFKEFLAAAAAAAAAVGHHHQLPQQQMTPAEQQQHVAALSAQLQQALAADAAVAAASGISGTNGTNSAATGSNLFGFSPSGFLGSSSSTNKLLSFTDRPPSTSSTGTTSTLSTKCFVPLSVMDFVDQLLSSRALSTNTTGITGTNESEQQETLPPNWWLQFIRTDETLDAAALPAPIDLKSVAVAGNDTVALAIRSEPLVAFVVDALRAGLTLDATLAMVHAAERWMLEPMTGFGIGISIGISDVVSCVRSVASANLSAVSMLTAFAWGYAVVLRFVTRHSTGYVDVRVQLTVHNDVHDLHVVAIPLDAHRHSPEAVAAAVVRALTAVDPRALEKLLGVTIDGDPFHMRKYTHVAQLLRLDAAAATASGAAFYVLYSGAYHISMVVEEFLDVCQDEFAIVATLTDLEALAGAHASLMDELGPAPQLRIPDTAGTSSSPSVPLLQPHWVHVLHLCEWFAMQREALTKWCHDHNESHRVPSNVAWVVVFLVRDILKDVYATFTKCVMHARAFADVQRYVRELIVQLRLKFKISGSTTGTTIGTNIDTTIGINIAGTAGSDGTTGVESAIGHGDQSSRSDAGGGSDASAAATGGVVLDESADALTAGGTSGTNVLPPQSPFLDFSEFSYQDFVLAVVSLDLFMYEAFQRKVVDGVGPSEREHVHARFNALLFLLLSKCQGLAAATAEASAAPPTAGLDVTTGTDFHPYSADIPPSTPYELVTMPSVAFMALLNSQQIRLRAKWPSGKVLPMITDERNRMVAECALRGAFYDAVSLVAKQQQHSTVELRDAWRAASAQFPALSSFTVAFGCLLAVPRPDGATMPPPSLLLSTVQLEAQLHARQFDRLASLRKHFDTVV